jgi:iron complex outermembrane receptor protein
MSRSYLLCGAAAGALLLPFSPALAQPHGEVETVVSTASPLSGTGAVISDRVDSGSILHGGGATIADALRAIPGVSGTGMAVGASRPIIRGMDASRVRVLENGTSSSDASDIGPDHGVPIDPLSARSLEVVRGAATLRYGSQAIGGVVNAINNRVPKSLPTASSLEATAAFDSISNGREVSLLGDTMAGNFAFHGDAFWRNADSYDTPLGLQPNSFFRGKGLSLGSSYFFGDNQVGAAYVHYDSRYGIPGETAFIDMRQDKALMASTLDLGDGLLQVLNFNGSYGDYSHDEKDLATGAVNSTFINREFDGRAEALLGAIGPFTGTALGLQFQNRDFSALGEGADYLDPTLTRNFAGFLFTQVPMGDNFNLDAAARIEDVMVEGTPNTGVATARGFTPLSGSLSALWRLSDAVRIGVMGSSTARAPAQTELYARGPHEASATFETGDPTLKAERSNAVEASLRIRLPEFSFDGSAYLNSFDNYIYGALTGRDCDEDGNCGFGSGGELREMNYLQTGATFRGLEGKAALDVWHTADESGVLKVTVLGDIVRATLAGGANVPRIPAWRLGGGLAWESPAFDAGFQLIKVGDQDRPGLLDTPTDGYVSLDAQFAWRPFAENRNIEFALRASNLADEVIRNAAALNKDTVVMPGRSVRLSVKYATN